MSDSQDGNRPMKGKRRGRKCSKINQDGKQYMCPCGKEYYSYPALYTHIKLNHDGHAPGKIIRPQKNDGRVIGASKIDEHNKTIQIEIKQNPIIQLIEILKEYPQGDSELKELVQQIPSHHQYKKASQSSQNFVFNTEDNIYDVKLAYGSHLFMKQFDEMVNLPQHYYNVLGLILLLMQYVTQDCEDRAVLTQGVIGLMPQFVNYFFVLRFDKMVKENKLGDYWFSNKQNALRIYDIFFRWMLYKKFTLTTAAINDEYIDLVCGSLQSYSGDQKQKQKQGTKRINLNYGQEVKGNGILKGQNGISKNNIQYNKQLKRQLSDQQYDQEQQQQQQQDDDDDQEYVDQNDQNKNEKNSKKKHSFIIKLNLNDENGIDIINKDDD